MTWIYLAHDTALNQAADMLTAFRFHTRGKLLK